MTELLPFRFKPTGGDQIVREFRRLEEAGGRALGRLRGGARDLPREFERVGRSAASASGGVNRLGGALSSLGRSVSLLIGSLSVDRLVRVGAAALQTADDLASAADAAGIGVERFQSLVFAFEEFDVTQQQTTDGLRRFSRRFGEFVNTGAGPAAQAIRQLGLEQEILSGRIRTTEQFLDAVLDRLGRVGDEAQVAALAAKLFGDDAGPILAVALRQGAQAIADQESRARALGLVMRRDVVEAGAEASRTLEILGRVLHTNLDTGLVESMAASMGDLRDETRTVAEIAAVAGRALGGALAFAAEHAEALTKASLVLGAALLSRVVGAAAAGTDAMRRKVAVEIRAVAAAHRAAVAERDAARAAAAAVQARVRGLRVQRARIQASLDLARADRAAATTTRERVLASHRAAVAVNKLARIERELAAAEKTAAERTAAAAAAQRSHAIAMRTARAAAGALHRALAFMGGIPGLIATAVTAFVLFRDETRDAAEAVQDLRAALDGMETSAAQAGEALDKLSAGQREVLALDLEKKLRETEDALGRLRNAVADELLNATLRLTIDARIDGKAFAELRQQLRDGKISVSDLVTRLQEMARIDISPILSRFGDLLRQLQEAEETAQRARTRIDELRGSPSPSSSGAGIGAAAGGAPSLNPDQTAQFLELQNQAARRLQLAREERSERERILRAEQRLAQLRKQFPGIAEETLRALVRTEQQAQAIAQATDEAARKEAEHAREAERVSRSLDEALARAREEVALARARLEGTEEAVALEQERQHWIAQGVSEEDKRLKDLIAQRELLAELRAEEKARAQEIRRQAEAEREAARQREQDFRDLSDTFFQLFTDKGVSIWKSFKAAGLRVLSDLAAASFLGTQVSAEAAQRRGGIFGAFIGQLLGLPSERRSSGGAGAPGSFLPAGLGEVAGIPTGLNLGVVAPRGFGSFRIPASTPGINPDAAAPSIGFDPTDLAREASRAATEASADIVQSDGFLGTIGRSFGETFRREFKELDKFLKDTFGGVGDEISSATSGLADVLGQAGGGAAVGFATTSILKGLGLNVSRTGGAIGGAIGSFLPIPGGSVIGSLIGGILGGLFKKTPFGAATAVSSASGGFGISSSGRGQGREDQAVQLLLQTISTIEQAAEAVGGFVAGGINLGTIGTRGNKFIFDPSGQGRTKGPGVQKFRSQEEALAAQLATALSRGIITGVGETASRLLREATAGTLQQVLEDAAAIESVPRRLKAIKDPVGAALDDLNRGFRRLKATFEEVGATTAELAQLEELYSLERERILKEQADAQTRALRDFLETLTVGDSSPLSLSDQLATIMPEFEALAADIEAGKVVDQDTFVRVAGQLLDIERALNGSTGDFFQVFERVRSLTEMAIENATRNTGQEDVPNPFADLTRVEEATTSTARDTAAMRDLIARGNELLDRISRQLAGGGASSGGGTGGLGYFDRRAFLA